jgi:uronate dehydrogenase
MEGIDVVVHLAAIPSEDAFTRLMEANVAATFNVFEAARECGVRRLVFASTNHVTGFYPRSQRVGRRIPFDRTLYAVTKVFGEALGRLYADKWGLDVICLRIGAFGNRPTSVHALSMWLSERDAVQLFTKAIMAGDVGFLIVYGLSRSRWSSWDNPGAALLAYVPSTTPRMLLMKTSIEEQRAMVSSYKEARTRGGSTGTSTTSKALCALDGIAAMIASAFERG